MSDKPSVSPTIPMMTAEQFSQLLDVLQKRSTSDPGVADALMALANQQARTVRVQNAFHPGRSVFSHPEGEEAHPKERLARETFFCGVLQENDSLTPSEISLFNQITSSKRSRNGTWTADLDPTRNRLVISLPHASINERMELPGSLSLILMEFIGGQDAIDPSHLSAEVLKLREQVAALSAKADKAERDLAELVA